MNFLSAQALSFREKNFIYTLIISQVNYLLSILWFLSFSYMKEHVWQQKVGQGGKKYQGGVKTLLRISIKNAL